MAPTATNSGIVTDATSGERQIPESVRADGSTRKAIKVRPGFRPAEDVELYRARNAVAHRERRRMGVPGAEPAQDEKPRAPAARGTTKDPKRSANLSWRRDDSNATTPGTPSASAASDKNAKRREARKQAKSVDLGDGQVLRDTTNAEKAETPKAEEVDPQVEREKKARNLKKKLKQAKDLKVKKDEGEGLLPEQIAKVIKINELIRELSALGFNEDGEKKEIEPASEKACRLSAVATHFGHWGNAQPKAPAGEIDTSICDRATMSPEEERQSALNSYRTKLIESREWEAKLKNLRLEIKGLQKEFDRTEENIKALQSVGQIIGEVLKQLDEERFIVKASSGPRYVVGCRSKVDKAKMKQGTRVALDMTTLTIMRMLPREVDPLVYNMSLEDPGQVSFAGIGGLNDQIRELREVIELPLKNPELFLRVGIKPPKGVLLYGPPGTGKTLLARAVACSLETNFLKVVSSAIVDKYIGESARLIREMFGYAKEHEPCIIFMDEIDAIGGRRFSEGTSADREIQRTLMELLNQLDGFDYLGKTKIIMATNRPDTLDPALLRAGRLDRKIEIPLPNEVGRLEILKIHAAGVVIDGDIDFESVVKMSDGLNGADLRNVVTEAGLFAIKDYRESINQDDFNKAVRKLAEAKKLEGKLDYQKL
ncbi:hypothetical protein PWT90_04936 [Aphanocladium album]|nr:hypothetical protein PWT90_04936 [Aphanocladium album]